MNDEFCYTCCAEPLLFVFAKFSCVLSVTTTQFHSSN